MVRHVHFKDGKFNIWNTFYDGYDLTVWVDEETIIKAFEELAINEAREHAKIMIAQARENNGCSVRFKDLRCKKI